MSDKRITPIQESINFCTERYMESKSAGAIKTMEAADLFLQYLQVMLSKERKLLKEAWDDGSESAYGCVKPEGPCDFDAKKHLADKNQFFKQFEP